MCGKLTALDWECDVIEYREVSQWMLVSNWLAVRLERHGEVIVKDVLGLGPIWGKGTTGALADQHVIGQISQERML